MPRRAPIESPVLPVIPAHPLIQRDNRRQACLFSRQEV